MKTKYVFVVTAETPEKVTKAAIKKAVEFLLRDMDVWNKGSDWVNARHVRVRSVDFD